MTIAILIRRVATLGVALALSVPLSTTAGQATSEQRIPVRKDRHVKVSGGEVALPTAVTRITELETTSTALKMRIEALETRNATLTSRSDASERAIAALKDSLGIVNAELAELRAEVAKANALSAALADSVSQLNQSMKSLRYGSLFGKTGFYVGVGTGANFTTGTLHDAGYGTGLNVSIPIGWSKPGYPVGFRTEWGVQTFEGSLVSGFTNIDPTLYTGTALLTLNLPINSAGTNAFYLMGGGGVFLFHNVGRFSALADRLEGKSKDVAKWGVTGGAGLELHVLGASSLFVQSAFTNVFVERSELGLAGSRNLRWIPLVAGVTLR